MEILVVWEIVFHILIERVRAPATLLRLSAVIYAVDIWLLGFPQGGKPCGDWLFMTGGEHFLGLRKYI